MDIWRAALVTFPSTADIRKPWPEGQIRPAAHFRVARMAVSAKKNWRKFTRLSNGIEPLC